jgi:hypothetical protein
MPHIFTIKVHIKAKQLLKNLESGMLEHVYPSRIQEAKAGGLRRVQGQPELHNEALSQKEKRNLDSKVKTLRFKC